MRINEQKILINGGLVNYSQSGIGKPIILLHNGGGFWQSWEYQIKELSKFYSVYAIDWPGFGKSDSQEGFLSLNLLVKTLEAFISKLNLVKVILIGNCIGGSAAYKYNQLYPNKVAKLIIFNICPGDLILPKFIFRKFIPSLNSMPKAKKMMESILAFIFLKTFVKRNFPKILFQKEFNPKSPLFKRYIEKYKTKKQASSRINLLFSVHTYTAKDFLLPGDFNDHMMIWGEQNSVTSYQVHGKYHIELLKPSEFHIIQNGGHLCMYEHPDIVNEYILNYLGE